MSHFRHNGCHMTTSDLRVNDYRTDRSELTTGRHGFFGHGSNLHTRDVERHFSYLNAVNYRYYRVSVSGVFLGRRRAVVPFG